MGEETFIVIIDKSAGNDVVGEMWQETKVFKETSTLGEVMRWALDVDYDTHSRKRITITKPHI